MNYKELFDLLNPYTDTCDETHVLAGEIMLMHDKSTAVSSKDLLASVAERESFERGGQVGISEACDCVYPPGTIQPITRDNRCAGCKRPRLANNIEQGQGTQSPDSAC